jgi:hypothetical protein
LGEPKREDRPYSLVFEEQYTLFATHAYDKRLREDYQQKRGLWRSPLMSDGNTFPPPSFFHDNVVLRELRRVFVAGRAIDWKPGSKTFFIYWMRAGCLARLKKNHPTLSERECQDLLFLHIVDQTPNYKEPNDRPPGGNPPNFNGERVAAYAEIWD